MQASRDVVPIPPARSRLVLPMGLGIVVVGFLLRLPDVEAELLDLRPYLDHPTPLGLLSSSLTDVLRGPGVFGSIGLPLLAGFCGLGLFFALEALIRRVWRTPVEVVALLGAALFVALPAQAVFHATPGGEHYLLALTLLVWAAWLLLSRSLRAFALGSLGVGLACAVHPGVLGVVPAIGLAAALGPRGRPRIVLVFATLILGVLGFFAAGGQVPAPTWPKLSDRHLALAAEHAVASPILVAQPATRHLLPTGYEALSGTWPVSLGAALCLLLLAGSALVVGMIRTAWGTVAFAAAGAGAMLLPRWIPGDLAPALMVVLPLLGLLISTLAVIRGTLARNVFLGVSFGLVVIAYLHESEVRSLALKARRSVFAGNRRFEPAEEPDPARLVLYAWDVQRKMRLRDQSASEAARRAEPLLAASSPPVLDAVILEDLRRKLVGDVRALPDGVSSDHRQRFEDLAPLEKEVEEAYRLAYIVTSNRHELYDTVAKQLAELIPRVLEYHFEGPRHPRVTLLLTRFTDLLRRISEIASVIGDTEVAVTLRYPLLDLTNRHPVQLSVLARDLLEKGEAEKARVLADEALSKSTTRDLLQGVTRGTLGRARMMLGDSKGALGELTRALGDLTGLTPGGRGEFEHLSPRSSLGYWLVAEILLVRYELARAHDESLIPQARKDLLRILDPAMMLDIRRIPALAFRGRLHFLEGELDDARRVLRELRDLEVQGILERADGHSGRLDRPPWRRLGLTTLREVLDPVVHAEEIADLDKRLERLK